MKKKLLYFVFIISLLTLGLTSIYLRKSNISPISNAAVKVVLNQTSDYNLSVKSLSSETSNYSDHQIASPYGYYTFKIFAKNGEELFSGKVEKNKVSFAPYEIDDTEDSEEARPVLEPYRELVMLLPFYNNAEKIIFYDENNSEIFQIDISSLELPDN